MTPKALSNPIVVDTSVAATALPIHQRWRGDARKMHQQTASKNGWTRDHFHRRIIATARTAVPNNMMAATALIRIHCTLDTGVPVIPTVAPSA